MSNSLPNSVVHAKSTDVFKKQLDKFWIKQEIIYNIPKFKELEAEV